MDFGLITEAKLMPGQTEQERFDEIMREVKLADDVGFDVFGASEQHFFAPDCTISAPEMVLAAAARETSRIKLRTSSLSLPLRHPLRAAEQVATLDLLSGGRAEFGTGRGNNAWAADGFEIDVAETTDRWREALEIAVRALSQDTVSASGRFWNFPEVALAPRPVQRPHPDVWYAAVSPDSHRLAGELGLGLMSLTVGVPINTVAERIGIYREAIADATPIAGKITNKTSAYCLILCTDTREQALEIAGQAMLDYLKMAVELYEATTKRTKPDVDFSKLKASLSDIDVLDERGMVILGDPDRCIEQLRRYADAGIDEVFLRMEGVEHKHVMRSIELIGEHVIPAMA